MLANRMSHASKMSLAIGEIKGRWELKLRHVHVFSENCRTP